MQLYRDLYWGLQNTCPKADSSEVADQFCQAIGDAMKTKDLFSVHHKILRLSQLVSQPLIDPMYVSLFEKLNSDVEALVKAPLKVNTVEWLPSIPWHGNTNQYHQWMAGFFTLKPLSSLIDGRNAWTKIFDALKWTLLLNGLAFILSIVLGMIIGLWSGTHDGSLLERILNIKLFALFALPSFWLATLLIYFFSSGEWFSILPSGGLGSYDTTRHFF